MTQIQNSRQSRLNAHEHIIRRLATRIQALNQHSDRFTRWRFTVFIVGFALTFFAFALSNLVGVLALILSIGVFSVVVYYHRQVLTSIEAHRTWRILKGRHLARMQLDWPGIPESGVTASPKHPFAHDLDLVGTYSIHRLVDTAVSRGGSERLRDWLLTDKADPALITTRQRLIAELRPLAAFRDKLAQRVMMTGHRGKWDGQRLLSWLGHESQTRVGPNVLRIAVGLALTTAVLLVLDALDILPQIWGISLVIYLLFSVYHWRKLGDLFAEALVLKNELDNLSAILRFLETYPKSTHPALAELCHPFTDAQTRPSGQLRNLGWILSATSLRTNVIFWFLINLVVPWDLFFASRLDKSKGDLAQYLPRWLDAFYELETLNSLANFAYLNPSYTFPVINTDQVGLHAQGIGHPLIPTHERVCNDFSLDDLGRVDIITGSNMSGKSSFLRTIGVNIRLSHIGSVVAAESMETRLYRVYTSIAVNDSVVDGISYFYAEVKRLKALLRALEDDSEKWPLFFLIDEIFRGTNNRERLIGSQSYVRALIGGRGCGLISTHDLELVHLADEFDSIRNYHFREDVADGRMVFDYRLRSGPSPTTNALRIMELEGLPVNAPSP